MPENEPVGEIEEGVDADHLAARIHQRSAGVAGVDGGIGLDEFARLIAIRFRVGPVQRADDAARHAELESIGIAEGQHHLARVQIPGVAPRNAGQIVPVDLDDGKIRQRVGADQLRRDRYR